VLNLDISENTFCVNPWSYLRINSLGQVSYCLRNTDIWTPSSGSYYDDFNTNEFILSARDNFLKNKFPAGCNRCVAEEDTFNGAFRKSQNFKLMVHHDQHFQSSLEQSPIYSRLKAENIWPQQIFVMFGNQCNLMCRMCSSSLSSALSLQYFNNDSKLDESIQVVKNLVPAEHFVSPGLIDWTANEENWKNFLSLIIDNPSLQSIQICGGEPFMHSRLVDLIDACLLQNKTQIKIVITTNGTIIDHNVMTKLTAFKNVFIDVSVEALHPCNDYVRVGSNYQEIKTTVLDLLKYKNTNFNFGIHLTPQAYTIEHLWTALDFAIEHNLEIVANHVHARPWLQIPILPKSIKRKLVKMYNDKYKDIKLVEPTLKKLNAWLTVEESEDLELLRKKFVTHTTFHDQMLHTQFKHAFPHLVEFFKDYGYKE
jgi:sulfatase maturation enzyme AslB (radical SAM superfamily)